jgi:hypothetical protein
MSGSEWLVDGGKRGKKWRGIEGGFGGKQMEEGRRMINRLDEGKEANDEGRLRENPNHGGREVEDDGLEGLWLFLPTASADGAIIPLSQPFILSICC